MEYIHRRGASFTIPIFLYFLYITIRNKIIYKEKVYLAFLLVNKIKNSFLVITLTKNIILNILSTYFINNFIYNKYSINKQKSLIEQKNFTFNIMKFFKGSTSLYLHISICFMYSVLFINSCTSRLFSINYQEICILFCPIILKESQNCSKL